MKREQEKAVSEIDHEAMMVSHGANNAGQSG